jgi:hypothetical protein
MGVALTDNFDEALTSVSDELPDEEHTLTVANLMEYAVYLHDKEGFFVFNDAILQKLVREKLKGLLGSSGISDEDVNGALETAAAEYVNYLLETIGETRPPLREGGPAREARRGHWADQTGNLAAHYRSRVDDGEVRSHDEAAPEPDEDLSEQTLPFPE